MSPTVRNEAYYSKLKRFIQISSLCFWVYLLIGGFFLIGAFGFSNTVVFVPVAIGFSKIGDNRLGRFG